MFGMALTFSDRQTETRARDAVKVIWFSQKLAGSIRQQDQIGRFDLHFCRETRPLNKQPKSATADFG
jgi:hypothetical protein